MCGEKFNADTMKMALIRITPACAGKSNLISLFSLPNQDHPRMCGEKFNIKSKGGVIIGSPPHVRGKELFM